MINYIVISMYTHSHLLTHPQTDIPTWRGTHFYTDTCVYTPTDPHMQLHPSRHTYIYHTQPDAYPCA